MKNNLLSLLIVITLGLSIAACIAPPSKVIKAQDFKAPEVKIDPKYEDTIKVLSTCKKQDTDISKEILDTFVNYY